jgi:hypothetical protein
MVGPMWDQLQSAELSFLPSGMLKDRLTVVLAARDAGIPRPAGNRKYFTQLESVVCVFPALGAETARSAGP